jgi:hypothetical protein
MALRLFLTLFLFAGAAKAQPQNQGSLGIQPPVAARHAGLVKTTGQAGLQFCFEIRAISAPEKFVRLFRRASVPSSLQIDETDPFENWESLASGQNLFVRTAESRLESAEKTVVVQWTDDQMREFIQGAQRSQQGKILFAPKVTVFDRETAAIADEEKVRFVTEGPEADRTTTAEAAEGTRFFVRPSVLQDGRVQADVIIRMCSLPNVHEIPVADDGTLLHAPERICTTIAYSAILIGDVLHTAILPPPLLPRPARTENRITLVSRLAGLGKTRESDPMQIVWLVSLRRISRTEVGHSPELGPAGP